MCPHSRNEGPGGCVPWEQYETVRDALRFYAAPSSWVVHERTDWPQRAGYVLPEQELWTYAAEDAGELARKALDA